MDIWDITGVLIAIGIGLVLIIPAIMTMVALWHRSAVEARLFGGLSLIVSGVIMYILALQDAVDRAYGRVVYTGWDGIDWPWRIIPVVFGIALLVWAATPAIRQKLATRRKEAMRRRPPTQPTFDFST